MTRKIISDNFANECRHDGTDGSGQLLDKQNSSFYTGASSTEEGLCDMPAYNRFIHACKCEVELHQRVSLFETTLGFWMKSGGSGFSCFYLNHMN